MTISSTANRVSFTGNGVTTAFSFPYYFLADGDLVVIETVIATGVQTTKTLSTHYTVAGAGEQTGGTVTMLIAPASTISLTIYRDPAATQETDFVENDPDPAEVKEAAFDKITMMVQRLKDIDARTVRQPEGDTAAIAALPAKVERASKFLAFDTDGDPMASSGTDGVPASPFMETVLDDASAADARTTLGAAASGANTDITSLAAPALGAATATTQSANDGSTKVATTAYADAQVLLAPAKNYALNGTFAIAQQVTMPTTDNAYAFDGWRLLLGAANAATVTQDTADVPTMAKYACKLVVGSGNNNKFGIWQPLEGIDIYDLRGQVVSLLVPLKATAGLTDGAGKTRIGIAQFVGTEDSISGDPISSWGSEGTNPTLAANWSFANTPAAIAVTTSWADYTVVNVSISATAVNLAIFIWSDDTTNTQTTDILRVGGYVTLVKGASIAKPIFNPMQQEIARAERYYEKSYELAVAPGTNSRVGLTYVGGGGSASNMSGGIRWRVRKRPGTVTATYWDGAGNSNKATQRNGASYTDNTGTVAGVQAEEAGAVLDTGVTSQVGAFVHYTAVNRL